jgi:hypothetical protein
MIIHKQPENCFEFIAIIINTIATILLLIAFCLNEYKTVFLTMVTVDLYCYALLTSIYISLYLLTTQKVTHTKFKSLRKAFIGFSFLLILAIAGIAFLQLFGILTCEIGHGFGNLVLLIL